MNVGDQVPAVEFKGTHHLNDSFEHYRGKWLITFGVTGLGAGIVADFGASLPIWFAFICLFIGTMMISLRKT